MTSEFDSKVIIPLKPVPANPEQAQRSRKSAVRYGLVFSAIAAILIATTVFGGTVAALAVGSWGWIPLMACAWAAWSEWSWSRLRLTDQPQKIVATRRSVSHHIGAGRGRAINRILLKDTRTLQLLRGGDESKEVFIAASRWNFETEPISPLLPADEAQALGEQLVAWINARLSPRRAARDQLVTLGQLDQVDTQLASELLRPPPKSKAHVTTERDNLAIKIPVRLVGRALNQRTSLSVVLIIISALGWLICLASGNWVIQAKLVLTAITVLALAMVAWAWHHLAFSYTFTAQEQCLEIKARRFIKDRVDQLPYVDISDITIRENDGAYSMIIHRVSKRKRQLLAGHREEELAWLRVVLRYLTGLD